MVLSELCSCEFLQWIVSNQTVSWWIVLNCTVLIYVILNRTVFWWVVVFDYVVTCRFERHFVKPQKNLNLFCPIFSVGNFSINFHNIFSNKNVQIALVNSTQPNNNNNNNAEILFLIFWPSRVSYSVFTHSLQATTLTTN